MNPVKAIFLILFMLSAIGLWGLGIYSADAGGGSLKVVDGYGITSNAR